MPKKICLIDMDGVLNYFNEGFMAIWNKEHAKEPYRQIGFPTKFLLEDAFSEIMSQTEVHEIMMRYDFFADLRPNPKAILALEQMLGSDLIDPFICTAPIIQSDHCCREKIMWVRKFLGDEWVKRTIITRDKTLVYGDWLIDDKPAISGVRHPDWMHVIFDQPYNRDKKEHKKPNWVSKQLWDEPSFQLPRTNWDNWFQILTMDKAQYSYNP